MPIPFEMEQFCLKKWEKIPAVRYTKDMETNLKRLAAVIAANGVSIQKTDFGFPVLSYFFFVLQLKYFASSKW